MGEAVCCIVLANARRKTFSWHVQTSNRYLMHAECPKWAVKLLSKPMDPFLHTTKRQFDAFKHGAYIMWFI